MTIVLHPAPILEQPTIPVARIDRHRLDIAADLLIELGNDPHAAGIAAPQIGSTMRMFAYRHPRTAELDVIVNPVIVRYSGEQIGVEMCLSFPDRRFRVRRPQTVVLAGETLEGDRIEKKWTGFQARLAFHEVDHLDGRLITTRGKEIR